MTRKRREAESGDNPRILGGVAGGVWGLDARAAHDDGTGMADSCPDILGGTFVQAVAANRWTIAPAAGSADQYLRQAGVTSVWLQRSMAAWKTNALLGIGKASLYMRFRYPSSPTTFVAHAGFSNITGVLATSNMYGFRERTPTLNQCQAQFLILGGVASLDGSTLGHAALALNSWHSLGVSCDGPDCTAYLDGVSIGTWTHSTPVVAACLEKAIVGYELQQCAPDAGIGWAGAWRVPLTASQQAAQHARCAAIWS